MDNYSPRIRLGNSHSGVGYAGYPTGEACGGGMRSATAMEDGVGRRAAVKARVVKGRSKQRA